MKKASSNTDDFADRFPSEAGCIWHLRRTRWPERGTFRCPKCTGANAWSVKGRLLKCASCGARTSVTKGTVFESSNLPLRVWFRAIWSISGAKPLTVVELQRACELKNYRTALVLLSKLRRLMGVEEARRILDGTVLLGSFDFLQDRRFRIKGKPASAPVAFAATTLEPRHFVHIKLRAVADECPATLQQFADAAIRPGSHIVSSGKEVIRFAGQISDDLDRWMRSHKFNAFAPRKLQEYLDEYALRKNWSSSRKLQRRSLLFSTLIRASLLGVPRR